MVAGGLLFLLSVSRLCGAAEFSTLELSSLFFSGITISTGTQDSDILTFTVTGVKAGAMESVINPEAACRKGLEYFFTALALPDNCFWANLNPTEPERIIDRDLDDTDFGRILLAADLKLKKDASELTNPKSATGKVYWERLYRKAEELGVSLLDAVNTRILIYPAPVKIHENGDRMQILESMLEVRVEQGAAGDGGQTELQSFASGLMEELVVPGLKRKINEHGAYAGLREVYHAMLLARWYKSRARDQRFSNASAAFRRDLEHNEYYGSRDVYRDYLESLKSGEYAVSERGSDRINLYMRMITRRYYSGGLELRSTVFTKDEPRNAGREASFSFVTTFSRDDNRPLLTAKNHIELRQGIGNYVSRLIELLRVLPLRNTSRRQTQKDEADTVIRNKIFSSSL